jgi:hypothetical protein
VKLTVSVQGIINHGTVTGTGINCGFNCGEWFIKGDFIWLRATPKNSSTYRFDSWSGDCFGSDDYLTFPINRDMNCTARFVKK